jgi:hypothetical protein
VIGEECVVADYDDLGELSELGNGGQGTVYAISTSTTMVYKEYNARTLPHVDVAALAAIVDRGPTLSTGPTELGPRLAWPAELVRRRGRVSGFLMPKVPDRFLLTLTYPSGVEQRPCQVQQLLNDDQVLAHRSIPINDRLRVEFLRDTAETMHRLHALGIAIGDLSPMNLYVSLGQQPRCFFIDCDAVRVDGRSTLRQVETAAWEVPRFEELATVDSDTYKFALLAIRLFAGDQETKDEAAIARADRQLGDLARLGLSEEPWRRPNLHDWIPALTVAAARAAQDLPAARLAAAPVVAASPSWAGVVPPAQPGWGPPPGQRFPPAAPTARRRGSPLRTVVNVLAVLAVLCVGGSVLVTALNSAVSGSGATLADSGNGYGSNGPNGGGGAVDTHQLDTLRDLMARSKSDRQHLNDGINAVSHCGNVSGGLADIASAQQGRRDELTQAQALAVDQLVNGTALRDALVEALQHSFAADTAYLAWAQAVQASGCSPASLANSHLQEAAYESDLATEPKTRFANLWNQLGVPPYNIVETDV